VAVQSLLQAFLVEGMPNQPYGACQHKEAVQVADLHNVLDLSLRKQLWSGGIRAALCNKPLSGKV
jgi:hypothetical protein